MLNTAFITCLEQELAGGIYQSQVKRLLSVIRAQGGAQIQLSLLTILPLFSISRRGLRILPFSMRTETAKLRAELMQQGVRVHVLFLPILDPRPTVYQNWVGTLALLLFFLPVLALYQIRYRYDILHCRSYLSCLGALLLQTLHRRVQVIFDPRGLYPEEGVVHGRWRATSLSFRLWKRVERWMYKRASTVVCLSKEFSEYVTKIVPTAETVVIPASIDLQFFSFSSENRRQVREELRLGPNTVFTFSGGLGSWHDPHLLGRLFKALSKGVSDAVLLLISHYDQAQFREIWCSLELPIDRLVHISCPPRQVPRFLSAADWALVPLQEIPPRHEHLTNIARTMTGLKVAEYLACGLPIIVNVHIQGVSTLLKSDDIGFHFDSFDLRTIGQEVARRHSGHMRKRCREVANEHFNISSAATKYLYSYQRLLHSRRDQPHVKLHP